MSIEKIEELILCEQFIKLLIDHSSVKETIVKTEFQPFECASAKMNEWALELKTQLQHKNIIMTSDVHASFKDMQKDINDIIYVVTDINRIKKLFYEKIEKEFKADTHNVYSTLSEWIKQKLNNITIKKSDKNLILNVLYQYANQYINQLKNSLNLYLEKSIKDHLQSTVNNKIIIGKINKDDGWKSQVEPENKQLIDKFEKEIRSDLSKITAKYDAPFIEQFYSSLLNRCMKSLLHKNEENEKNRNKPTCNNRAITRITKRSKNTSRNFKRN